MRPGAQVSPATTKRHCSAASLAFIQVHEEVLQDDHLELEGALDPTSVQRRSFAR